MSEAIELYKKVEDEEMKPCGIFYCSKCRSVHGSQKEANECCVPRLCACGKQLERYQTICDQCQEAKEVKCEQDRFNAAKKVHESEYTGSRIFYNDKFYSDVESLLEQLEDDGVEPPSYAWACENVGIPKASLSDVTDRVVENMWEGASESDLNGLDELEAAINAFNDANKSVSMWEVDYSTAVLTGK